ncbi:MAG: hypothetical protein L3J59_06695 [Methylococcaceae bacterium]|nr:hypothetical protein [Methylococcaceae bacterium]
MNQKNNTSFHVLLLVGWVGLLACSHIVHALSSAELDTLVNNPVQSGEVDIDVSMDKDSYMLGEIPKISISGYNKTDTPKTMNVLLAVSPGGEIEYDYPGWKINATEPWLSSYTIPQNYQLPSTFLTTMEGIKELTPGKWYVSVALQDSNTKKLVSFKVRSFTIGNNTPPSGGSSLDGMLGIWSIVDWRLSLGVGGPQSEPTDQYVMIFGDGTMTYDMGTVLNEGIEISKARNAKRWGNWRITDKGGEYRWSDWSDPKYDDPISTYKVESGTTDQRLDRCFGRIIGIDTGLDSGDLSSSIASGYCFRLDGRFSHSAGASSTSDDAAFTSNTKQSGHYRIDGHFITFTYGDGVIKKTAFGFLNKEHTHIMINIKRMIWWGAKE